MSPIILTLRILIQIVVPTQVHVRHLAYSFQSKIKYWKPLEKLKKASKSFTLTQIPNRTYKLLIVTNHYRVCLLILSAGKHISMCLVWITKFYTKISTFAKQLYLMGHTKGDHHWTWGLDLGKTTFFFYYALTAGFCKQQSGYFIF